MPDDYTADITTTGTVTVGGTATGELETSGDEDWFAVTLTAGQIVSISLDGISLSDPYLNIYDSAGNFLFSNDDGGPGLNSFLTFEVTVGGTFYIGARAFSTEIGTYQVSVEVTAISSPTTNPLLEDIDWGTQIVSNTINVFFAPSGYAADGYTSEGFNAYEMAQFQTVFNLFESIADLHFNIVTSDANADFILVLDTNEIGGAFLGYFNPPGTSGAGIGVFDGASWDRSAGGDLERGGNGFYTIIHELGHGLGLAHPHDDGGTSTVMDGVTSAFNDYGTWDLNQGVYTMMSYNPGWYTGPAGTTPPAGLLYGEAGGPMALDIAALQENYGANMSTRTGNNTYTLPGTNATGTFFESIWDAGGTDAISYTGVLDVVIDLRQATIAEEFGGGGYVSYAAGIAGGFTIAQGVDIENAEGGDGDDTITGNNLDNLILGSGGRDEIDGRGGNDSIEGGNQADALRGGGGNDTLLGDGGFDFLDGGTGDDSLLGGDQTDKLAGRAGNDILEGGAGADSLYGGDDNDLLKGEAGDDTLYGHAGSDTLKGGADNDDLFGGDGADELYGNLGNDLLRGGNGQDTIDGGAGDDRLFGDEKADIFVFNDGHGNDSIKDFDEFNDNEKIDLTGVSAITSLADLDLGNASAGAATQVGGAVVIDTGGGNSITIAGCLISDLDANDFII